VVIPAAIRKLLEVGPGGVVMFTVEADGRVRLLTPQIQANELWAMNSPGAGRGDAVADVRAERTRDRQLAEASPPPADETSDRDVAAVTATAGLLAALGFGTAAR
jgi:bifunctional DNA-binding transcriptional regulator/antitoxin component of YhaV-PrlF toxin-antitoxin module